MNFEHIKKLAEYNGKLPKLLSEIAKEDTNKAIELLNEWANAERPLEEIYNDALNILMRIEKEDK